MCEGGLENTQTELSSLATHAPIIAVVAIAVIAIAIITIAIITIGVVTLHRVAEQMQVGGHWQSIMSSLPITVAKSSGANRDLHHAWQCSADHCHARASNALAR